MGGCADAGARRAGARTHGPRLLEEPLQHHGEGRVRHHADEVQDEVQLSPTEHDDARFVRALDGRARTGAHQRDGQEEGKERSVGQRPAQHVIRLSACLEKRARPVIFTS